MGSIAINKNEHKDEVTVVINGEFDFHLHRQFRNAYKNGGQRTSYIIDMHRTQSIDSAALGMLLLLREHVGSVNARVRIIGCNEGIMRILQIANFNQLFTIT